MFYRMHLPMQQLEKHGHEVTMRSAVTDQGSREALEPVTLRDMQGFDVIVAQRFNTHRGLETWRRARTPTSRLVYDTDDDVTSVTTENFAAWNLYNRPDIQDAHMHSAQVSDLVTVTGRHLAEVMHEHTGHQNIKVLPNYIPAWVLDTQRPERKRPAVGWSGGASHARDVGVVVPPVRRFLKRFPGWDIQFNGTDYRPTFKAGDRALYADWVPVYKDPEGYYATLDFDIGLIPLAGQEFDKSKCVDAGTRISTDQGVIEAGLIRPGMKVWRDGWREVIAVEHGNPRSGWRITTARGLQVTVTPEHRLAVSSGEWVPAADLVPGAQLQLIAEECPDLPCQEAPWPADGRMTRAGNPDPVAFLEASDGPRIKVTERWARILGLFTGDGSFSGKTALAVHCDGQDQDLIKSLMADLEAAGFRPTTEAVTMFDGRVLRRRSVRVASAHLSRFLVSLGVGRAHRTGSQKWERTLCVPDVIFRSPQSVRAAFLAGLFEADGNVAKSAVSMTTKSADLARDVQQLLWSIGVPSVIDEHRGSQRSPYADRTYWKVRLRMEETRIFAARVGFLSRRKQAELAEVLSYGPAFGEARLNKRGDRRGGTRGHPINWSDEIISVEHADVCPVDIQVEGEAFALAGILSHNSNIKAVEYASRGIVPVATDCEIYRSFIRHGENGFLVKAEHEWLHYMSILASDDTLREQMAATARKDAAAWTIEEHWTRWRDAYEGLFTRKVDTSPDPSRAV